MDTQSFSSPLSSQHESSKFKTSFQGEFKSQTTSESQTALNNFKKRTKRDASVYPIFKNDKYYDTFQRSFLANLKAQGLYDVADPDHDPESGDIYEQELFQGKQSFVYSVLVTSLQTEKGRELVKEFEGDARSIILKLHHYHTQSNVAQHDIITLTTEITNLTLNDSWKGTVRQFLSHFKEKLRLLDSLVPVSDQLPETTRLIFLQRAVPQNHDLRQIHVMDSVWRFKTDSTEALTFDTYYNLLWDAAHQYDLHQTKKGPQRKAFSSQQEDINDVDEYANAEEQFSTDPEPVEHSPYSVYQSSFHPKMPQKSFLPRHIWDTLSDSTKQMIIEHNKKVKLNNPTPYPSGSKTKPNPTLGKSNPAPKQIHQHSQNEPTEESPPDTSTQNLVNKCLTENGIDPTDIQNVLSVSQAKQNMSSHEPPRQIQSHQRYSFAGVHQTNHQLIDRGANGGLAGADMRIIHTTPRKINIVGIGDHELTGLNVVTAATLLDTKKGPIIGVFHEYAHLGKGKSIHAAGQMEWFNCKVDDRSQHVGGTQSIQTSEAYVIPLFIEYGLVYMQSMRIPTDHDLQHYPHVHFTSPDIWDTLVLDRGIPPSLPEKQTSPTFRLVPPQGEDQPHDLTSDVFVYGRPNLDESDNTPPLSIINDDDLLGSTSLQPMKGNGERKRATIPKHAKDIYQPSISSNKLIQDHNKWKKATDHDKKYIIIIKTRLVIDGHSTKVLMAIVYPGIFFAEPNNLELWRADFGNAYLQALTRERLYIVGALKFEELQGHILVMYKALYGTRSGGAYWHDKFFDILHDMVFKPSKADPDIWMKSSKDGSHYEHITVYVDDLAICMKDTKSFCDTLKEKYKIKLKGVDPINYHLGYGYARDEDGTLVAHLRKYVEKILESYEKTFAEKPKKTKAPLVGGDHPESDTSDFCDQDQTKQYQTIVGQLIWLAGLGRFDIAVHVITMSRFRQPKIRHLERIKKIVGYLANFPHGALRFRLHESDYSNLPHKEYDWQRTVYGGAKEEIPHDIPEPKRKYVTTTTYVNTNLHHDQVTGKAVTACLHIVNATPSYLYTKRQTTVETATYGSEFVAARIATDQINNLRYTLMYLGVPVRSKSHMFGDNKSVVDSASIPTSTLSKKSTLASYHRVREAIAAGYLQFNWKDEKSNPADILSKHWEVANIWPLLKPLLFWKGDTDDLNAKTKGSDRIPTTKSLV